MGTLPEGETAEFEEHLLICERCQARLARQDDFAHAMRMASLRSYCRKPQGERGMRLFPRLAPWMAAAAVLLVLALGWSWIRQTASAPAVAVRLEAVRGSMPGSTVPAGKRLTLQADLSGLPDAPLYTMTLVDRDGRQVWKGTSDHPSVPGLRAGQYFVRVYSTGRELLREYGLEAR